MTNTEGHFSAKKGFIETLPYLVMENKNEGKKVITPQEEKREKRTTKVTSAYKSPYIERRCKLGEKMSDEENMIAEYIFAPTDEL